MALRITGNSPGTCSVEASRATDVISMTSGKTRTEQALARASSTGCVSVSLKRATSVAPHHFAARGNIRPLRWMSISRGPRTAACPASVPRCSLGRFQFLRFTLGLVAGDHPSLRSPEQIFREQLDPSSDQDDVLRHRVEWEAIWRRTRRS